MISMSKVNDIRRMRREGETVASIARKVGVSRDTVYRYLAADDLSPKMPAKRTKKSRLDPWRPLIESWLDEDRRCWRKQRHTAHRIWVRLTEEQHVEISEARVRQYVAMIRRERGIGYDQQFLDLDWAPGIAQADFGEADFYVMGARTRLSYFVLSFPFSNVGVAQVFASENAECVCQALRNIFEFLSGVPTRIVFDNATGVLESISISPIRRIGHSQVHQRIFASHANASAPISAPRASARHRLLPLVLRDQPETQHRAGVAGQVRRRQEREELHRQRRVLRELQARDGAVRGDAPPARQRHRHAHPDLGVVPEPLEGPPQRPGVHHALPSGASPPPLSSGRSLVL